MKYREPNHYIADEGKTFRRIEDAIIMGNNIYLYKYKDGSPDKIDNYEEVDNNEKSNPHRQNKVREKISPTNKK